MLQQIQKEIVCYLEKIIYAVASQLIQNDIINKKEEA